MKRSPLKRRIKPKSSTYWRKKCVQWAKEKAKERDGFICLHCGRKKEDGWQMHGSHILPEGVYVSMSADPENIICLCATCHNGGPWANNRNRSWHGDPLYFSDWFRNKWPGRYEKLLEKAQPLKVINWEEKWKEI